MRSLELAKRNLREVWRDPLSLGLTFGLTLAMFLVLQALQNVEDLFSPTNLAPGIVLFGFVMLMFSAAMTLSRDRESALFDRLLTAPLRAGDFVAAYSLPYLPVAIFQAIAIYAIAAILGLEMNGSWLLVSLVLLVMALLYIALGMILGAMFTIRQIPFIYTAVMLLTIFGGAWMDLEAIGGVFESAGRIFPFAHALDAVRGIMLDGAGFGDIAADFIWVVAYTMVAIVAAVLVFRRRLTE